jgi:hypothetical protein
VTDTLDEKHGSGAWPWSLTAALLLLAALAGPSFLGRIYTHDDLGCFHLPIRAFYAEQLARREPVDWMPSLFCGFDLTGEGQGGTYHPWHWLLYRTLPLPSAWTGELVANYALLLAGTYCFLRRWRMPAEAAMFGSLAFTFSGFNLLRLVHPNAVAVIAHLPWLLWAIDRVLRQPRPTRSRTGLVWIALLTASQILLGYPQYVWFSLLVEAGYVVFVRIAWKSAENGASVLPSPCGRGAGGEGEPAADSLSWPTSSSDSPHPNPLPEGEGDGDHGPSGVRCGPVGNALRGIPGRGKWPVAGFRNATEGVPYSGVLLAKLAGLMLGGVQLLPTMEALGHAARHSAGASFTDSGSLHPLNLVQLIAPYLFVHRVFGQNTHELTVYLGAVPLMLILWVWIDRRNLGRWRKPAAAAALLAFGGLLLAFGAYGQVYRLQRLLPLVGNFRFPCRYTLLFTLAMAVLAAIGLVLLRSRQTQGEKIALGRTVPLWSVAGLSLLSAIVGLTMRDRSYFAGTVWILAGPILIASAALLATLAARGYRFAMAAMVLLTAVDLGYYGLGPAEPRLRDGAYAQARTLRQFLHDVARPPTRFDGRVVLDLVRYDESLPHVGDEITMLGYSRADGYAGLAPAKQLDYHQVAALRVADVAWVERNESTAGIVGLEPESSESRWLAVPAPLARVRLVAQAQPSRDPAHDIAVISPETSALVQSPLSLPPGPPGYAFLVSERPGRLEIQVDCPASRLLVISESYHPGWQATIDGRPERLMRVNGDFLGCVVPGGRHEVRLAFRSASLRWGLSLSGAGLLLSLLIVAVPRRHRES